MLRIVRELRILAVAGLAVAGGVLLGMGASQASANQILTTVNMSIPSAAAGSDMIISDGTSWTGGAVGVQGSQSTKVGGGSPLAADVTFKFDTTSTVSNLNATYGAGNWAIGGARLVQQVTYYANNNRFGSGAGTFNIYWAGNDNWTQGTNNPAYATTESALAAWSPSETLLDSASYAWVSNPVSPTSGSWVTDKNGPTLSFDLSLANAFVTDAQAGGPVSLYLMATSPTMGMCIFTGGGNSLPTLSLDIVAVPEPATVALLLSGLAVLSRRKNR